MSVTSQISATRRALACFDLLVIIFKDNLSVSLLDRHLPLRRRDLVSFALVCRAWREPALRSLWRDLPSSCPLWNLFRPQNISTHSRLNAPSEYYEAVMSARLWTDGTLFNAFLWYCGYVRKLDVRSPQDGPFFRALLEQLEGQRPIFPNLEMIAWRPEPVSDLSLVPLFSQSLRQVYLDYDPFMEDPAPDTLVEASTLGAIVSHLRQHSPLLEHLTINAVLKAGDSVPFDVMSTVASFRNLQWVYIRGSVSISSFRALVSNPSLASIDSIGVFFDDPPVAHKRMTAHELREIDITGTAECLTALFKSLHAPRPQKAQIETSDSAARPVPDYVSCVAAFGSALDKDTFQWLHMKLGASISAPFTREVTDLVTLLGPLLPCRRLAHFSLTSRRRKLNLAATDDDIDAIARAWPQLEIFTLSIPDFCIHAGGGTIPTAAALHSFWRNCPELCELTLPHIDLLPPHTLPRQWFTDTAAAATSAPVAHPLTILWIDPTRCSEWGFDGELEDAEVALYADYLQALFPGLDLLLNLPASHYCVEGETHAWTAVFDRLREFGPEEVDGKRYLAYVQRKHGIVLYVPEPQSNDTSEEL